PGAVIMWGARPQQRVCEAPLHALAERATAMGLSNPAVIVVGEVVALRDKLNWFENKPLFGRRILVPRPVHQAQETANQIRERGAEAVVCPVIEVHAAPEPRRLHDAAARVGEYDWLLFTSANGVNAFFAALALVGADSRRLGRVQVGAIGPRTASALDAYGIKADLVAKEFVGEGLASALLDAGANGKVLLPRALEARDELPNALRAAGLVVDVVPAYETKPIPASRSLSLRALFEAGEVDTVMFTSSSMVSATVAALGPDAVQLLAGAHVASIGPITSKTATDLGLTVNTTATEYTVGGLLDALEAAQLAPIPADSATSSQPKRN